MGSHCDFGFATTWSFKRSIGQFMGDMFVSLSYTSRSSDNGNRMLAEASMAAEAIKLTYGYEKSTDQ